MGHDNIDERDQAPDVSDAAAQDDTNPPTSAEHHTGEAADQPAHGGHRSRHGQRGENRLPPAIAVLLAAGLYLLLPQKLLLGPRFLIPALELVLLIALVASNPWRLTRETRWSRIASIVLSGVIVLANLAALSLLIHTLVDSQVKSGGELLLAALEVWVTNVIAFGLIYWELDRGGPVARTQLPREEIPLADLRFSHDEDRDTVTEVSKGSSKVADWMPTLVDYLYLSVTNSSAFGPTDTMPLSSRFKILMGIQATAGLLTSLLVIARAVGALT